MFSLHFHLFETDSFIWEIEGKRKFPFPFPPRNLLGKCPLPQNFQHKEYGKISPFLQCFLYLITRKVREGQYNFYDMLYEWLVEKKELQKIWSLSAKLLLKTNFP